jgi:nucleotide-binding universal stress UspA family protein
MTCLIEINQTTPSPRLLYEAACRHRECRAVYLVHVIASGRPAEVEAGQRLLAEAARALRRWNQRLSVEARLEIGETAAGLLRVAAEIQPALIVMSAHGEGDFPRLYELGRAARRVLEQGCRPVLFVSPCGDRLRRPRRGPTPPPRSLVTRAPSSLQSAAAPL